MNHQISDPNPNLQEWHRGHAENRIGGVCTTIAYQFGLPVTIVRAAFVVAALVPGLRGFSILLYLAIWGLTPPAPGEESTLDRTLGIFSNLVADFSDTHQRPTRPNGRDRDEFDEPVRDEDDFETH